MSGSFADDDAVIEAPEVQTPPTVNDESEHESGQGLQRYGFTIGPWRLLFPGNCPGEVVMAPEICAIPHTRHWMLGVMVLRGNLIPVFDLHTLLLEAPLELHKPTVLVLGQGKRALGFVVKEPPQWLTGLVDAPRSDGEVPPLLAQQPYGVYCRQGVFWIDFNETELFTFLAESAKTC